MAIIFETERLTVRHYRADEQENFFRMNGDEEIVRYIRPAKTREESDRFLEEVVQYSEDNPLFGRWAIDEKRSGDFVGTFALIPVTGSTNFQVGYSLVQAAWGKGYATELTSAGIDYFFEKTTLDKLYAITEAENTGSQKVLKKLGFRLVLTRMEGPKEVHEFVVLKT